MKQIQPIINENIDSLIFGHYSNFFNNNSPLKNKYGLVINYEGFIKNPYGEFLKFLKLVGDMHNIHFIQDQEYTRYANTKECKQFLKQYIPFPMIVIYFKERVELSSINNILSWTSFKDVLSMVIPSSIKNKDFNEIIKLINSREYNGDNEFYHDTNSKEHPFRYKLPNKNLLKQKQESDKLLLRITNIENQLVNVRKDNTVLTNRLNQIELHYNSKIKELENKIEAISRGNKIPLNSLPSSSTIPLNSNQNIQHNPMMYGNY